MRVFVDGEKRTYTVVGVYRSLTKSAYTVRTAPAEAAYVRTAVPERTIEQLRESAPVVAALNNDEVRRGYRSLLSNCYAFIYIGALVGAVVAVLVIFSNVTLAIFERQREFNIIRTLGYTRRDILVAIGAEVVTLALVAAIPGLLLGILGGKLVFRYGIQLMDIHGYSMVVQPSKVVTMLLLVTWSIVLVVYPAYRWLSRMDITELNQKGAN